MRAFVSIFRPILALFALLLSTTLARAEGLVQLTFHGEIGSAGGAPIELELGFWNGTEVRELSLNVHLAERTRAHDLAALVAWRLRRMGAEVEFSGEGSGATDPAHLFVEGVTQANLRLGHGMWAAVTLCDSAPRTVRFLPPELAKEGAEILIAVTTFHPHDRRLGNATVALDVDRLTTSAQLAEQLANASIAKGWMADRPTPDRWAASRTSDGASISGCSVELRSPGADWRVEVALDVPRSDAADER